MKVPGSALQKINTTNRPDGWRMMDVNGALDFFYLKKRADMNYCVFVAGSYISGVKVKVK